MVLVFLILPSDGTTGQVLKTDGSGTLSFVDQSSSLSLITEGGKTDLSGRMNISILWNVAGNIKVVGTTNLKGGLRVEGNSIITGSLSVGGNSHLTGH